MSNTHRGRLLQCVKLNNFLTSITVRRLNVRDYPFLLLGGQCCDKVCEDESEVCNLGKIWYEQGFLKKREVTSCLAEREYNLAFPIKINKNGCQIERDLNTNKRFKDNELFNRFLWKTFPKLFKWSKKPTLLHIIIPYYLELSTGKKSARELTKWLGLSWCVNPNTTSAKWY